ncbi:hypothetical protein LMG31506_04241 [Cupriavidus yeoncheonensis]|uniref:Uncharacterized protein n=1 Tax=Cupriavidus yeoncheonensis TaxID=1462994 RepID=A0A916IWW5_9BURK|nr:hypothetical protein LMG31506_04241 [Cupriavidus yeoncheonensis]
MTNTPPILMSWVQPTAGDTPESCMRLPILKAMPVPVACLGGVRP